MIAMDSVWNDGAVEEFYLVLLDRRLDYSVRICQICHLSFACCVYLLRLKNVNVRFIW